MFRKWGLDAVAIGHVTADGILRVKDHGQVVAEIPNRALADEAPLYDRPHTKPYRPVPMNAPPIPSRATPEAIKSDLIALLSSGDICSKRWIWEQYDHTVRTNTLAGPGSDAAIVIHEKHFNEFDYQIWEEYGHIQPARVLTLNRPRLAVFRAFTSIAR